MRWMSWVSHRWDVARPDRLERYMNSLVGYIPVFLFIALAFAFPIVTLLVAKLVRPHTGGRGKLMPYECGVDPDSDARQRYAIRYYVVAILIVGYVWIIKKGALDWA